VVPVAVAEAVDENAVVKRAKARAMRAQLLSDLNGLHNRQRKLPEDLLKAEKDACYTEQALADAERKLTEKQVHHDETVAKLEALRKEKARNDAEVAEIEAELRKLGGAVEGTRTGRRVKRYPSSFPPRPQPASSGIRPSGVSLSTVPGRCLASSSATLSVGRPIFAARAASCSDPRADLIWSALT